MIEKWDSILKLKDTKISEQKKEILELKELLRAKDVHISNLETIAQSLRLKNRLKRVVKRFIPNLLWSIAAYIKNHPGAIKKSWMIIRNEGISVFVQKINHKLRINERTAYAYKEPQITDSIEKEIAQFTQKPLISIIMPVYNVDSKWLSLAIESVEKQWYTNWELCIADDASTNNDTIDFLKAVDNKQIKIKFLDKNQNISGASNEALAIASGEYIALLDNDDELTPDALFEMVKAINIHNADFIYSDEDNISLDGHYVNPHYKADFSPDLLLTHNYITHFVTIHADLIKKIGGFRSKYDGAQDHDLLLRVVEDATKIVHIPKVLYHWRMIETSTSYDHKAKPKAQQNAKMVLEDTLKRRDIKGSVLETEMPYFFRVKREVIGTPLVSIIIPFKDKPELLKMCIESILLNSTYENFEIIAISNNSKEKKTFEAMKYYEALDSRVKFYEYNVPFNYSKINNYGATLAKGEHLILLNNDIEIITPDWIECMLGHSQCAEVGAVGAKLYYPDDTIQHAGVIIGIGGVAGHAHKCFPRSHTGYFNRLMATQNFLAVTAACLMVKKSLFDEINGLDEKNLAVAFNDVDFCLRLYEKGYLNVFTPYAEAYHHESISRGYEDSEEKIARFKKEESYMKKRHATILKNGDPFYNPNLTLEREDFTLR